eukprot:jgi/Chrzof1/8198/Cz03g01070.t1
MDVRGCALTVLIFVLACCFGTSVARPLTTTTDWTTDNTALSQARPYPPASCTPFNIPSKLPQDLKPMCQVLRKADNAFFDKMWRNGPAADAKRGFPLKGCTLGCIVGLSPTAAVVNYAGWKLPPNGGFWSGKCFDDWGSNGLPTLVANQITSQQELESDWHAGMRAALDFNATISIRPSITDNRPVWFFDYNDTPQLRNTNLRIIDEVREVPSTPGMVIGKAYIQHKIGMEKWEFKGEFAHFALFQVCDKQGGYPFTPESRVLTRQSASSSGRPVDLSSTVTSEVVLQSTAHSSGQP